MPRRAPQPRKTCTAATGDRLTNVPVHIEPALLFPHEAADFALYAAFAVEPVVRSELHCARRVQGPAIRRGNDVQPAPLHVWIEIHGRWTGGGVPSAQEVAGIKDDEGGIPGAHELLGRGRVRLAPVEASAAIDVLLAGEARAGAVMEPG